jgi:hypothetical protein
VTIPGQRQPDAATIESISMTDPDNVHGNFEGRWDSWRARGAGRDHGPRRLLRELVPALVIVAVIVYVLILIW